MKPEAERFEYPKSSTQILSKSQEGVVGFKLLGARKTRHDPNCLQLCLSQPCVPNSWNPNVNVARFLHGRFAKCRTM